MVQAMLLAATHPHEVVGACESAVGGREEAVANIAAAIGVSPFWAEIVAGMSVIHFTPDGVRRLQTELTDLQARLASMDE